MIDKGRRIFGIFGHEPPRQGEYPLGYVVGADASSRMHDNAVVERIEYREANDLGWFDVWIRAEGIAEPYHAISVAAKAIAELQLYPPEQESN